MDSQTDRPQPRPPMNGHFRKARTGPVLSREASARQGQAVRAAATALADIEAARLFLNRHHDGLDGRPLDLAVASDAGLAAVEAAIAVEARRRPGAAGDVS